MQTYEKCADYIQTHFMLLREEQSEVQRNVTAANLGSGGCMCGARHSRVWSTVKVMTRVRTISSLFELASNCSCRGVTLQRSRIHTFMQSGGLRNVEVVEG